MIADIPADVGARRSADAGSKQVSRSMTTETREFLDKVRHRRARRDPRWTFRRADDAGQSLMTTETREFLVPTVPVGMPSSTLCVVLLEGRGASRTAFPMQSIGYEIGPHLRAHRDPSM
jgi:hypothetical protein